MKYDVETKLLRSDDGTWVKRLDCPLNKRWHELQPVEPSGQDNAAELRRHCPSCNKDVVNICAFDDRQVGAMLQVDPAICVHASEKSKHITFEGTTFERRSGGSNYTCTENTVGVTVVQTGRTVYAINLAAKSGYRPLLKPVAPSDRIKQKVLVSQNVDGTLSIGGDFRAMPNAETYWYNPYHSPLPFAAYLIPLSLRSGERVYIPDLIEDVAGEIWNQGDVYRRKSAYAVWDGTDLRVEQDEPLSFVG